MVITLTAPEWAQWQASGEYRQGFRAALLRMVPDDIGSIELQQPDGTKIVEAVREWKIV